MLLINLARTIITILGLLIVHAFTIAYDLTGLGLVSVAAIMLLMVFMLGDIAEAKLVEYFNRESEEA